MSPKPFEAQGYEIIKYLRDNGRSATFVVKKDGNKYFAKQTTGKEPTRIENDVWWMLTMRRLNGPDSPVRAPLIYEHGEGWFISEYIEKPLLIEPVCGHGEASFAPLVPRMVEVLVWLDNVLVPHNISANYDLTNSAPYDNLMKKVDGWLERPLTEGRVEAVDYQQAKDLVQEYQSGLVPSFQHGDFVPWHFFNTGDQLCLFDGEHSGVNKPKYYDLAYIYTRLIPAVRLRK